jgi:hypothetical protein
MRNAPETKVTMLWAERGLLNDERGLDFAGHQALIVSGHESGEIILGCRMTLLAHVRSECSGLCSGVRSGVCSGSKLMNKKVV